MWRAHVAAAPIHSAAILPTVFWVSCCLLQATTAANTPGPNPLLRPYHANETSAADRRHFETKPLTSYDVTLRQTVSMTRELWRLVDSQLTTYAGDFHQLSEANRTLVHRYIGHATLLLESRLRAMDETMGLAEVRRRKLETLGRRLQQQLTDLQNPPDCSQVPLLVVLFPNCELLCQVRHATLALSVGLALKRTVVLAEPSPNWVKFFLPLSKCPSSSGLSENQMVLGPNTPLYPKIAPPALPADWTAELADLHGNPYAWFRGQMLVYLWRFRDASRRQQLDTRIQQLRRLLKPGAGNLMGFRPPLAGLDISQLPSPSQSGSRNEYYLQLERFFEYKHMEYQVRTDLREDPWERPGVRHVFLATDDPRLEARLRADFPNFNITTAAAGPARSLEDRVAEIFLLASTEFLICSLRSPRCRLAYELMLADNAINADASLQVYSVDTLYADEGDQARWWSLVNNFESAGLKMGDAVRVSGLNPEGFLKVLQSGGNAEDKFLPAFMLQEEVIRLA